MKNEINVGLLSYGMAGNYFHAPFIHFTEGMKLTKVLERHSDNAVRDYPYVQVVRNLSDILDDDQIDLVVIATPHKTHFDYGKQSILAGKHVVMEKPFTPTSDEAQELIELAQKHDRVISPFQNRRLDSDFLTVKKLLEDKKLGELIEFESHFDRFRNYLRPDTWKEEPGAGSGVLYDLGTHLIDQTLILFGLPEMITADIRIQRDYSLTDDYFELILHYGRLKVTLKAGTLVMEDSPRFILHGTEGSFVKYGVDPQEEDAKQGQKPSEKNWGVESENLWGTLYAEKDGEIIEEKIKSFAGCYQNYYGNIRDVINNKTELLVKPEEARNTIRVIELAYLSNKEKRTVDFSIK
ncbi:MAG: oxidoreductase [Ignavibacteriaceae bacterium]